MVVPLGRSNSHINFLTLFRINSYLPSLLLLPAAVHVVLTDLVQNDLAQGREQRKVFLSGS